MSQKTSVLGKRPLCPLNTTFNSQQQHKKQRADSDTFVKWHLSSGDNNWTISVFKGTPLDDIKRNISDLTGIDEFVCKDSEDSVMFLSSYLPNNTKIYIDDKSLDSNSTMCNFKTDDMIDCCDAYGGWYLSQIKKHKKPSDLILISENELTSFQKANIDCLQKLEAVYIHYIGWNERYDEWIFIKDDILCECNGACNYNHHRIASLKTQSEYKKRIVARNNKKTDDKKIILRIRLVRDEDPLRIKVKITTEWTKIFDAFATSRGIKPEKLRFNYAGQRIPYCKGWIIKDVFNEYDLSDDNEKTIVAMTEMCGS